MRLYSWNVNGIRAAFRKGFWDWLQGSRGEIVALQETRAKDDQIPKPLVNNDWHFNLSPAERAGYSGVGLFSRLKPDWVETHLEIDDIDVEGRLQIARFGDLLVVNGYFPNGNGKNRDLSRIPYKLRFYRELFDHLELGRQSGAPILVVGDFNTAHRAIDLARPKANVKTSGFRPEEREELDRWLRSGWTDTFREFNGEREGAYTWWSQRFGVRERNVGWRIDYILASPGAMPFLRGAAIHAEVMGSDHCPISVDLDPVITGALKT